MSAWAGIDERDDHYLGLAGANVVATEALLVLRDNLADVLAAKAMMCVHGDAGLGKTLSVNASLRALAPADVCRVQFRARPTPRDIRHVLFDALAISGTPPPADRVRRPAQGRPVRTVPGAGCWPPFFLSVKSAPGVVAGESHLRRGGAGRATTP